MVSMRRAVLDIDGLQALLDVLSGDGYRVLGPTIRDKAIVYDDIAAVSDLPRGWTDRQDGGHYRLVRRDDEALFGFAVGTSSWKQFLHLPSVKLWHAHKHKGGWRVVPPKKTVAQQTTRPQ